MFHDAWRSQWRRCNHIVINHLAFGGNIDFSRHLAGGDGRLNTMQSGSDLDTIVCLATDDTTQKSLALMDLVSVATCSDQPDPPQNREMDSALSPDLT
jgi:hypothetical protein